MRFVDFVLMVIGLTAAIALYGSIVTTYHPMTLVAQRVEQLVEGGFK